jgi:hypothetical protein
LLCVFRDISRQTNRNCAITAYRFQVFPAWEFIGGADRLNGLPPLTLITHTESKRGEHTLSFRCQISGLTS